MIKGGCNLFFVLIFLTGIFMIGFCSAWIDNGSLIQYVGDCGNLNQAVLNTTGAIYILNTSIYSPRTCFNVTKDNITIDGNGFTITGESLDSYNRFGVYARSIKNLTVKNLTFDSFGYNGCNADYGAYSCGAIYLFNVNNSNIFNVNISSSYVYPILLDNSFNNNLRSMELGSNSYKAVLKSSNNNTLSFIGSITGVLFKLSNNNTLRDSNFLDLSTDSLIELMGSSSNLLRNISISGEGNANVAGIYLTEDSSGPNIASNNNILDSLNISLQNVDYSIYLTPSALGFTNNFLLNNNLAVGNVGSIGIFNILNKNINTTIIYNNSFGEIKWWNNSVIDNSNSGMLSPISYPGIINIVDNFVSMDSTLNSELNISANVTLYNIGNRGFYRPSILKNGAVCTDCWNYTSLSASTVIFRVSSWSNYSIGNYSNISLIINFVNFTDVSGSNFTTKNFIRVNVSVSVSNFFNVTINLYNSVRSLIRTKLFDYNMLTGWNSSLNRAVNNSLDIDNLDILWNYSMPSEVINSPLVVEDRIYICSFNALSPYTSLYALNATNGSILWRSLCGSNPDYYSVAYSNGIIYLPYYDGTSTLFARNATNGTQIWNATIDGRIFDYSTPAVSDGRVYINSMNNLTYALNATNGSILWNYTSPGTVYSGPAVYDGKIFLIANDGKTYALNATNGTQIWNYSFGLRFGVFSNSLRYSSVFAAEGYAYFGDLDNGTFYALNATNGSLIWSNNYFDNFLEFSTSVAFKGVVYFLDISGIIFAANATNGSLIWNYSLGEAVWYSNPTIAGDLLFIGSNAGRLYAINITNGSRAWSYVTSGGIYSSPAIADGKVFIGSNDKKLYAFGSSEYKMTFPNLPNGLYFFNATSCDSYGFCNYTETRNITIDYHFCGDGVCDSNENCGSCSSDCGVCPSTFVSGVSGGAGGGALTQKPSLRIDVPHPITLESIGPVEFNITLENDGSFNFNKVFLEGNLLENSESVASSVKFIPDNLAVFSIKKKETIAVSTYVYNEEIAVYEVVINASSKSPVYHTQAKVYLTFVGKNGSGVAKIVAFTEGLIDQNAECIELSPMIVDAKRLLESGEWKSGLEKTQLALEACKKILEGPKKASSRILSQEGKLVLYLVGAIIGAIVFAVFFNLYKLWKFRKLNNSLKGLSYSL